MRDPSNPVFETTDSGFRVAGTGQPRLETAARAGEAARPRGWFFDGWKNIMLGRRRPRMGESKGRRCVLVDIDGHTPRYHMTKCRHLEPPVLLMVVLSYVHVHMYVWLGGGGDGCVFGSEE